jgi:hypothetical protein
MSKPPQSTILYFGWTSYISACALISSHKDFSLERSFYIWFFISSHCSKNNLNITIYLFNKNFFYQKFLFTHHINILFPTLIIFQHFQVFFRQLYKTNGKYGVTVYLLTYQRPFQFFVNFFFQKYV